MGAGGKNGVHKEFAFLVFEFVAALGFNIWASFAQYMVASSCTSMGSGDTLN